MAKDVNMTLETVPRGRKAKAVSKPVRGSKGSQSEGSPYATYEKIVNAITDRYPTMSERFQQVARFFTQNPNTVALESINAIGAKCKAHPSILVRFAQSFGYTGFKQMQAVFQTRLATAAPGFQERINALEVELQKGRHAGNLGYLRDLVVRDIATLQELLEGVSEATLSQAARYLKSAQCIYVVGQLRSAPVALFMRYVLTMLQRKVILLDAAGGLGAEMARMIGPKDALIAISFRHYAKEVVSIAELAKACGAPVIAITDGELSPLAPDATVLFSVPEGEYSFSRSLAAPMCLAQGIAMALAALLQPDKGAAPHIASLTELERERKRKN